MVEHFKNFLGPVPETQSLENHHWNELQFRNKVSKEAASLLSKLITNLEIEEAIKFSSPLKSPGSDGFNNLFFKLCGPIVGEDVSTTIKDFFHNGKMLKELNYAFVTLILKIENLTSAANFSLISLPNELYKVISRIMAYRLKQMISRIINPTQSAFIPGKSILDNVLLSHELIRGFHLDKGSPKMFLKIDLSKAFDMLAGFF